MRRALLAALAAASLALVAALSVGGAGAATILPDCAPGTPAPPPPTPVVTGEPSSPTRIVAGRPFTIDYTGGDGSVTVQSTTVPPGTLFDPGFDAGGSVLYLSLPAAGPVPLTAHYYLVLNGTCVHRFPFTVNVEPGDLVPAGLRVGQGELRDSPRFERLPRRGVNTDGNPAVGLSYGCTALEAIVPITAVLREERDLRRSPSPTSHTLQIAIADPCQTKSVSAVSPGVALKFVAGSSRFDEGLRTIGVEHRAKAGRRYQLQILQGDRVIGGLRYYAAFRSQNGPSPALWVVAPEAAFERARCKRPKSPAPLGLKHYPFPPCPRRG